MPKPVKTSKTPKKLRPLPLILLGCLGVGLLYGTVQLLLPKPSFAAGQKYLQQQASLDLNTIQDNIAQIKKKQLGASIASGETTIFAAFGDAVLLGDSRMYGFDVFGYLPSSQVLAGTGYTILNIQEFLDQLKAMQPRYVYLSYGANDMVLDIGADLGKDGPGYAQVYAQQIDQILEVCPSATIVINSIIPCTPEVADREPAWDRTEPFNTALKEMCQNHGWVFVNNDPLAQQGEADFYASDGVHFDSSFYPIWARNMIKTAIPDLLD